MGREDPLLEGKTYNFPPSNFYAHNPWKIIKNEENPSKTSLVLRLGIGAVAQNLTFLSLELAPSAQHPYLNWCPSFKPYGGAQAFEGCLKEVWRGSVATQSRLSVTHNKSFIHSIQSQSSDFLHNKNNLSFYIFTSRRDVSFKEKTFWGSIKCS